MALAVAASGASFCALQSEVTLVMIMVSYNYKAELVYPNYLDPRLPVALRPFAPFLYPSDRTRARTQIATIQMTACVTPQVSCASSASPVGSSTDGSEVACWRACDSSPRGREGL